MLDPRAKFVTLYKLSRVQKFSIFESPIINSVCPQILHKLFLQMPLGYWILPRQLKTINFCKFWEANRVHINVGFE